MSNVPNRYARWTGAHRARLATLWRDGETVKAIARELGRTPNGVEEMRAKMKLPKRVKDPAVPRLRRRLAWQYGATSAAQIMDGRDPAANADLAAWNRLGTPQERAA